MQLLAVPAVPELQAVMAAALKLSVLRQALQILLKVLL